MNRLVVEWRHLAVEGETCERCGSTGMNLRTVVAELTPVLGVRGIALELREELLSPAAIARSNDVLVGGTPIEELVGGRCSGHRLPVLQHPRRSPLCLPDNPRRGPGVRGTAGLTDRGRYPERSGPVSHAPKIAQATS